MIDRWIRKLDPERVQRNVKWMSPVVLGFVVAYTIGFWALGIQEYLRPRYSKSFVTILSFSWMPVFVLWHGYMIIAGRLFQLRALDAIAELDEANSAFPERMERIAKEIEMDLRSHYFAGDDEQPQERKAH